MGLSDENKQQRKSRYKWNGGWLSMGIAWKEKDSGRGRKKERSMNKWRVNYRRRAINREDGK